jgi:hypothetical protein
MSVVMAKQAAMIENVAQLRSTAMEASTGVSTVISEWSKEATRSVLSIGGHIADSGAETCQVLPRRAALPGAPPSSRAAAAALNVGAKHASPPLVCPPGRPVSHDCERMSGWVPGALCFCSAWTT